MGKETGDVMHTRHPADSDNSVSPHGPEDLIGQFILCRTRDTVPEGWTCRDRGPWVLGTHPSLPVVDIRDSDGESAGWLLGYLVDVAQGKMVTRDIECDMRVSDADAPAKFESILYEYGGRFAAVSLIDGAERFYLDPSGSLAAVFCQAQQIAASTTTLVPRTDECGDNTELIRMMGIPERTNWYPFGLTPRHGVDRLLPNHYLDLSSWQTVRHWPTGEITASMDVQSAAGEIAPILKNTISAVARAYPLHMPLTAGRDSRMLLACAREHLERTVFFTYDLGQAKKPDAQVARKLARRFGLNHVIVRFAEPGREELSLGLYRTGGSVGGLDAQLFRVYEQFESQRALLSGQAGDVVRACYWRDRFTESSVLTPADLLKEIQVTVSPESRDRAGQWLDALPIDNPLIALDMLYIEQRLGCWAGPRDYGHVDNVLSLYPFSHRRVFQAMLSLSPQAKQTKALEGELIRSQWPELLELPFNAPLGLRGFVARVRDGLGRRLKRLTAPGRCRRARGAERG